MKHLKTSLAMMLAFALLAMSCAAFAEGLPYMQQLGEKTYSSSTVLLSTESYPEVCISPYYFSSTYISQYKPPYYVHFPCPADTLAVEFDEYSCSFINMEYGRQYIYAMQDSAAFETFINNAEKDEYILDDGSSGAAIYLDPDDYQANALIAVKEIDKSTKLQILFYDPSLRNKGEQQVIDALTAQITDEVARIRASISVDLMNDYWSKGRYAGFTQICTDSSVDGLVMTYTLPADYMITDMSRSYSGIANVRGVDNGLTVDFYMGTYSYVEYMQEEEPESVTTVEIDGNEYRVYANWSEYSVPHIISVDVDRTLAENVGYSGDDKLYLTLDFSTSGNYQWTSMEAFEADLTKIVSGIQIEFGADIPDYRDASTYTGSGSSATAAAPVLDVPSADAPAAPTSEAWTCPSCGSENNGGKFCSNCGTPRPAEAQPIVCANCGYQPPEGETPKFCPECGTQF